MSVTDNRRLLLVIGVPGCGKSSLVARLTDGLPYSVEKKPFWHTIYYTDQGMPVGAQLGWTPEFGEAKAFGGTDRLAQNVIVDAVKWLRSSPLPHVIVEGDRLANARFIDGAMTAGYSVEIAEVVVPNDVGAYRRHARGGQDPTWVAGRISKVENLVKAYTPWVVAFIDGTIDHDEQLRQLAERSAVTRALMEAK